jgi:beta propeller repeat protein
MEDADVFEGTDEIDFFDGIDARDAAEEVAEAEIDFDAPLDVLPEVHDVPSDLEPHECVLPIRDCGPGCRQVTCAAIILDTYAWDVSGKYVTYFGLMESGVPGRGLYVKDLESGVEALATGYPNPQYGSGEVTMEGPRIAYRLVNGGDPTYCRLSLRWIDTRSFADNVAFCYYSNPDGENFAFGSLDIFNDVVVWYGHDEGESTLWDLFMFDLTAMQMTRLTYADSVYYDPKIWGRNVVFERWASGGGFEVFLMDLDTTDMTNLTGDPSDQWDPDIRENRVVWTDHRNGPGNMDSPHNSDIYWCDLPDCVPQPATINWASQLNPTTGGDWIVWIDSRNAEEPLYPLSFANTRDELWGYNLSTGQEVLLFSWENTLIHYKLRVENGKLYFLMAADPSCLRACYSAVFELDLEQFL